jgi:hypothetical protein
MIRGHKYRLKKQINLFLWGLVSGYSKTRLVDSLLVLGLHPIKSDNKLCRLRSSNSSKLFVKCFRVLSELFLRLIQLISRRFPVWLVLNKLNTNARYYYRANFCVSESTDKYHPCFTDRIHQRSSVAETKLFQGCPICPQVLFW